MWPECVVSVDSFSKFKPHSPYAVSNKIKTRIEFFAEGAVTALDTTVVFRPCWRQHNERDRSCQTNENSYQTAGCCQTNENSHQFASAA